jgi:predicted RNase H-like nuclease (RuvC/YqgF family)
MNPHLASGLAEAPTSEPHPAEQQVTKLEEENSLLRQRVQELEDQLMQMQLVMQASMNGNPRNGYPQK